MNTFSDQDPDYGPSVANDDRQRRIYEENARSSTARKIIGIVEKEFSQEINAKEKEALEIQERLHGALKTLHLLRYVIITDFYNRKQCQAAAQVGEQKQTQIHPAIKRLIGKSPKTSSATVSVGSSLNNTPLNYEVLAGHSNGSFGLSCGSNSPSPSTSASASPCRSPTTSSASTSVNTFDCGPAKPQKRSAENDEPSTPRKLPRYVPPKSELSAELQTPSRANRNKVRKRIIIGNISKWIPPDWREDAASHKWTMYVRGSKENPDIDDFVGKVRFFLHPSYRPNDVVEVSTAPFCLSRRGWGEFPLRVQLHFKSPLNKPMDVIHHLKLDRTYTGLQTLGAETLVDIWVYIEGSLGTWRTADTVNSERQSDKDDTADESEVLKNETLMHEPHEKSIIDSPVLPLSSQSLTIETVEARESQAIKNEPLEIEEEMDENVIKKEDEDGYYEDKSNSVHDSKNQEAKVDNIQYYISHDHDYCGTTLCFQDQGQARDSMHAETYVSPHPNREIRPSASNLCPLKITIPPLFDPTGGRKRVLVRQNDKTIPVDISYPRTDEKNLVKLTVTRGVSLLKKQAGANTEPEGERRQKPLSFLNINPSGSILLNANYDIPALKIAERIPSTSSSSSTVDSRVDFVASNASAKLYDDLVEEQGSKTKITLGKDKHKLCSKRELYEETFRSIEAASIADIRGLLKFIIVRLPMVTENATDPDYQKFHPYSCRSEAQFFEYCLAKRRALEWYRARMAYCLLKKKSLPQEDLWSVKEIMIWARVHGYVPLCSSTIFQHSRGNSIKNIPDLSSNSVPYTYTEPIDFHKWLQAYPNRSKPANLAILESQMEIDVVGLPTSLRSLKTSTEQIVGKINPCRNGDLQILELNEKLVPLHNFVCETTRQIGIHLVPEEVAPGVVCCLAARMISSAVECLVDELVRMSLAKAWQRHDDTGYPNIIVLEDVRQAILGRAEFDVFTNQGLGSKNQLTALD